MDKLKKSLKLLFAPAIVLLLVAIMGIFSPIVSVAAALRVNTLADEVGDASAYPILNLPARTVKLGTKIVAPSVTGGTVKLCHAGKEDVVTGGAEYTYEEVGQYEWRFYANETLFNKYSVTVTDTEYAMTMPDNVATVLPKDLQTLSLPLPNSFKVDGKAVKVEKIEKGTDGNVFGGAYANITVDGEVAYVLTATVALENRTFDASKISFSANAMEVALNDETTGNLKVTYRLYSADAKDLLVALPLSNIQIKNVNKNDVTFANIPTAPSVKNLAYYSSVSLTAPTVDSAKADGTSFNVEADTKIFQVQCSPFATEPSDWSKQSDKIHTLTVEKDAEGKWVVKENGEVSSQYLEVNGLTVKVKALGWYRFQFETTTMFGYQLDEDFDTSSVNIQQDNAKSYVRYWSDSIRIYRDSIEPDFAWVKQYSESDVEEMDENFADLLDDYAAYLPMTEKPDANTAKKITVNSQQGLVLPAIFPHDNATPYNKMKVTTVNIEQVQGENGNAVSKNDNYVWNSDKNDDNDFVYDMTKRLQISFVADGNDRVNGNNNVQLFNRPGLYRVRVIVEEEQPKFANGEKYSAGYANTKTKYLYFYLDDQFECAVDDGNSPVIDENKVFQVSDVYLWEGNTFEFKKPVFTDAHTSNDNIQVDYYLVGFGTGRKVLSKLDASASATRVVVDLDNLYAYDADKEANSDTKLVFNDIVDQYDTFYIYTVARNFNAMQTNLKAEMTVSTPDMSVTEALFKTNLLTGTYYNEAEMSQYGYAWKRAEFAFHKADSAASATINTSISEDESINKFTAGKPVKIQSITANWGSAIDGQMSVAAYLVKGNNILVPVDVKNSDDKIVSSVAFNRASYTMSDLYFTPSVGGTYRLVVTAKNHASKQISTSVQDITIHARGGLIVDDASADENEYKIDETITLGESTILKNKIIRNEDYTPKYYAKNRKLYTYDANGVTNAVAGNYTVTVLGVNDANCIYGNKFVPNQAGIYTFVYKFYLTGNETDEIAKTTYTIKVSENTNKVADIRMGEDYDAIDVLWKAQKDVAGTVDANGEKYILGSNETGTDKKPAYAIPLNEFTMSNYGYGTDFVVDSASLFNYLEPIFEAGQSEPTGYMYPAIAIPMPNVIADNVSSDEVEITVQKSGSSTYLVSNKKKNAGGSSNKESVIEKFDGYFVFRPEGKFSKDCKSNYTAQNYLESTTSPSGAAGVYTVTYKTVDSSLSFNVTFGNLQNGSLAWEEGFLTYKNDDGKEQEITNDSSKDVVIEEIDGHRYVTIDMSKVYFTGNADMEDLIAQGPNPDNGNDGYDPTKLEEAYYWNNVNVTVTFEGGSFIDNSDWTDEEGATQAIKITDDGKFMYKFDLNKGSGTYKVNISMPNKYTASTVSTSIEFTIDVDVTNRNHNLNNVWGIILIVLSLGLLAGVVYYFIKTARATRFVDVPRAPKNKKKPAKSVEEKKDDVK